MDLGWSELLLAILSQISISIRSMLKLRRFPSITTCSQRFASLASGIPWISRLCFLVYHSKSSILRITYSRSSRSALHFFLQSDVFFLCFEASTSCVWKFKDALISWNCCFNQRLLSKNCLVLLLMECAIFQISLRLVLSSSRLRWSVRFLWRQLKNKLLNTKSPRLHAQVQKA